MKLVFEFQFYNKANKYIIKGLDFSFEVYFNYHFYFCITFFDL
jgi:hypothetical protein